jgi:hypothetical protein
MRLAPIEEETNDLERGTSQTKKFNIMRNEQLDRIHYMNKD